MLTRAQFIKEAHKIDNCIRLLPTPREASFWGQQYDLFASGRSEHMLHDTTLVLTADLEPTDMQGSGGYYDIS